MDGRVTSSAAWPRYLSNEHDSLLHGLTYYSGVKAARSLCQDPKKFGQDQSFTQNR